MKINVPRHLQGPAGAKRKSSSGGDGSGFAPQSAGASSGAGSAGALSGASAINSVDALLTLQAAGDYREARKRATERAFSLLDVLDDLKMALLDGGIPRAKLSALMELLKSERDGVDDPRLEAALDEVELRAAVELAKYHA